LYLIDYFINNEKLVSKLENNVSPVTQGGVRSNEDTAGKGDRIGRIFAQLTKFELGQIY
jgi:hypothetical protein